MTLETGNVYINLNLLPQEQSILDSGKINNDVGKASKFGQMEVSMKVIGPMIRHVEKEN